MDPKAKLIPFLALLLLALVPGAGCGESPEARPASSAASGPLRVVFVGDSLTSGGGLHPAEAFPALVQAILQARCLAFEAINAGVSGNTAAQGLARLDPLLDPAPDLVFVCLGAKEGLRHHDLESIRTPLRAMVEKIRATGSRVALAGIALPPTGDVFYASAFEDLFPSLAGEFELPFLPSLLEGVAGQPGLSLPDRLHPNAQGQKLIAARVADFLEPLLRQGAR